MYCPRHSALADEFVKQFANADAVPPAVLRAQNFIEERCGTAPRISKNLSIQPMDIYWKENYLSIWPLEITLSAGSCGTRVSRSSGKVSDGSVAFSAASEKYELSIRRFNTVFYEPARIVTVSRFYYLWDGQGARSAGCCRAKPELRTVQICRV